jgi:hypothetical protein
MGSKKTDKKIIDSKKTDKKAATPKTIKLSSIDFNNLNPKAQQLRDKRVASRDIKYKILAKYCDLDLFFSYEYDWLSPDTCGPKYRKDMNTAISWLNEYL